MKKLFLIMMLLLPQVLLANIELELKEKDGKLDFLAVGNPGFLKINGKGVGPTGTAEIKNDQLSGKFIIPLKTLDTGMSLRNKHMKEKYLKTEEFPEAILVIENYKLPEGWSYEKAELSKQKISGTLQIHGVKKPIEIVCSITPDKKMTSEFDIKISDFAVEIPSFMGVTVADKVNVKVQSKLHAKASSNVQSK